ncbi:unnamed protein product [Brachionus calyciflorus]|uniref:Glycoprotein-N-acetylgalactosamine 3-beta-galactosyltransferase 1 n=1 Tax=Brachionus calyciflorus TaxID=104777 RepID=A0A813TYB9_9BILA|nr:unnamed protein product [Brachionus calyciflorus]
MIYARKFFNVFVLALMLNLVVLNLYKSQINFEYTRTLISFNKFNPRPTIFCIILTNPKNFLNKTLVVNNTWAQECDEHKFITVIPEYFLNISQSLDEDTSFIRKDKPLEVSYPFNLFQPSNHTIESYHSLTSKMYKAYLDIYKIYPNYDWYLKADDDTYIFMDNLRDFLNEKKSSDRVTYGFNLKKFQSGGAGYVLSKKTLSLFGENMLKNGSFCRNTGSEDTDLASCLEKLNVTKGRTEDNLGRERFHPYDIKDNFEGKFYDWLYEQSINPIKSGANSSSSSSISFHYMSPEQILRTHTAWKAYQKLKQHNKNVDFHKLVLNKQL